MIRVSASGRARRLLAIVPWIASRPDGADVGEVCERFGVSRDQLLDDLGTMSMVGTAPFTPDQMVEVLFDGDRIRIALPQAFSRPLRITPSQALALVAAGAGLRALPSQGEEEDPASAIERGLDKLVVVLGIDPDEAIDVELGGADPEVLAGLREALADSRVVHLRYYAYGRDEHTERHVDPLRLHHEQGNWYLSAFCRDSAEERLFRVDRIEQLAVTAERFEPPDRGGAGTGPSLGEDLPRVVLDLPAAARWVIEQYPHDEAVEHADGRWRVSIPVAGRAWLERLLLNLGAEAKVVEPPAEYAGAGPAAARRVLDRYR